MAKAKTTKKDDNEKIEKTSQRFTLDAEVYRKLRWVASANEMKISDYVNKIFSAKFETVTEDSSIAELLKIDNFKKK